MFVCYDSEKKYTSTNETGLSSPNIYVYMYEVLATVLVHITYLENELITTSYVTF